MSFLAEAKFSKNNKRKKEFPDRYQKEFRWPAFKHILVSESASKWETKTHYRSLSKWIGTNKVEFRQVWLSSRDMRVTKTQIIEASAMEGTFDALINDVKAWRKAHTSNTIIKVIYYCSSIKLLEVEATSEFSMSTWNFENFNKANMQALSILLW